MEAFRVVLQPTPSSSSSPSLASSLWRPELGTLVAADGSNGRREHMFDKVVTPSDVGKLNRLVIPKQFAERFFPLEPDMADKGVLLCFEDAAGEQWSFRYSYWHSSQSYVMTKGWSRFVKEKHLHAGDTVSFLRAPTTGAGHRLFIDLHRPRHFYHPLIPYDTFRPWGVASWGGNTAAANQILCYNRTLPGLPRQHIAGLKAAYDDGDTVLDSVPVVIGGMAATTKSAPKRFRLFGVNLECPELPPPMEDGSNNAGWWRTCSRSGENEER
ncbi:B3 domain-containing protein Os02g0683500-like [Zingiber officinale]|uniref:TF-B3 domain-containing protein n=1 Tax=Zingiber officinale TaxID=94328 RepID=A0A8J5EP59_ZINOF|nr:B3 domain-containing protein Os02g0683500-like [Zingiber officinale]KAG6468586.1 hypothetical protein ZIOFF_073274 [Zingiber officinale]